MTAGQEHMKCCLYYFCIYDSHPPMAGFESEPETVHKLSELRLTATVAAYIVSCKVHALVFKPPQQGYSFPTPSAGQCCWKAVNQGIRSQLWLQLLTWTTGRVNCRCKFRQLFWHLRVEPFLVISGLERLGRLKSCSVSNGGNDAYLQSLPWTTIIKSVLLGARKAEPEPRPRPALKKNSALARCTSSFSKYE